MKILLVSAKMVYGGLSLHVLTLSKMLMARGHEVEIVSMCPGPLVHEFETRGIPISTVPLSGERIGRNPLLAGRSFAFVRKNIRNSGFDVVHTHGPSAHLVAGVAARSAKGPTGRPVFVASVHGSYNQFASGHVADASFLNRGWKKFQYGAIDAITGRVADRMVAVCDATAAELADSLRVPPDKITVIHNGIEEQKVSKDQIKSIKQEFNCQENEALIVYVGRIAFHKGCTFLIEAMKQVVDEMPNARLVMVGTGPLEDELRANCAEGPLAGKVKLTGSRTDVAAIIAASDLMVLPSLSEGLPLTLLEAAMQGRAMVASDTGGILDVVRPGSTGLLVSPRSAASIAKAVIELLQNDAERERLGQNARKLWEENYTADVMTDRMENLYNDMLSDRKGRGLPA